MQVRFLYVKTAGRITMILNTILYGAYSQTPTWHLQLGALAITCKLLSIDYFMSNWGGDNEPYGLPIMTASLGVKNYHSNNIYRRGERTK